MSAAACRQRGLSLIELLVSVVIGMMVVVAVVLAFLGSGRTQRRLAALTQMNEEAQLALNAIKREIQMAGAVDPAGMSATPVASFRGVAPSPFPPVFGCSAGFANPTAAPGGAGCKPQGPAPVPAAHAIESNYQVLQSTLVLGGQGQPMDCAGHLVTFQPRQADWNPAVTVNAAFVSSRLYVDNSSVTDGPQLKCAGERSAPVALADNVESMTLWFGISGGWDRTSRQTKRPVRFVSLDSMGAGDWSNVVAVRVCLQMRSAESVLGKDEDVADYRDCTGAMQASDDGRLRSAFFATATVRNRVGF